MHVKALFSITTAAVLFASVAGPSYADTSLTVAQAGKIAFGGRYVRDYERFIPKKVVQSGSSWVLISESEFVDEDGKTLEQGAFAPHVASGGLAVHYLTRSGKGWKVSSSDLDAGARGPWGTAPDWSISTALHSSPVLYSSGSYSGMGVSCDHAVLTPLLSNGIGTKLELDTGYDDEMAERGPVTAITGKIANIVKGQSFDLVFSGKKKVRRFAATEKYVWQGRGWKLSGRSAGIDGC